MGRLHPDDVVGLVRHRAVELPRLRRAQAGACASGRDCGRSAWSLAQPGWRKTGTPAAERMHGPSATSTDRQARTAYPRDAWELRGRGRPVRPSPDTCRSSQAGRSRPRGSADRTWNARVWRSMAFTAPRTRREHPAPAGGEPVEVKPPALVSSVTPPIFAVFRAVPDEAGLDAAVAALTACYSRRRSSQMSLRTRQQSMGRRPARPTPAICYASNFPSPGDWLT
jgi:hypothetical protein